MCATGRVFDAGGVGIERGNTAGRVGVAARVALERTGAGGGVEVAGGVGIECKITAGCVGVAFCVVEKRIVPKGRILSTEGGIIARSGPVKSVGRGQGFYFRQESEVD